MNRSITILFIVLAINCFAASSRCVGDPLEELKAQRLPEAIVQAEEYLLMHEHPRKTEAKSLLIEASSCYQAWKQQSDYDNAWFSMANRGDNRWKLWRAAHPDTACSKETPWVGKHEVPSCLPGSVDPHRSWLDQGFERIGKAKSLLESK